MLSSTVPCRIDCSAGQEEVDESVLILCVEAISALCTAESLDFFGVWQLAGAVLENKILGHDCRGVKVDQPRPLLAAAVMRLLGHAAAFDDEEEGEAEASEEQLSTLLSTFVEGEAEAAAQAAALESVAKFELQTVYEYLDEQDLVEQLLACEPLELCITVMRQ